MFQQDIQERPRLNLEIFTWSHETVWSSTSNNINYFVNHMLEFLAIRLKFPQHWNYIRPLNGSILNVAALGNSE